MKSKIQTSFERESYEKFTKIVDEEGRSISKTLEMICDFYQLNSKKGVEIVSPN